MVAAETKAVGQDAAAASSSTKPKKGLDRLQAKAAPFVPNQENGAASHGSKHRARARRHHGQRAAVEPRYKLTEESQLIDGERRALTSVKAPQFVPFTGNETIAERIQHALLSTTYECCICVEPIKRNESVYEDQHCWAVFHLKCITAWAKRALQPNEGRPQDTWRCPACQAQSTELPREYRCWCGKQIRPEVNKLAPHSCGQTCGKQTCPHPCPLPCHPGPCPPCIRMAEPQQCFCGKHTQQKRCTDTDYTSGSWSCQEICGEMMPCDEHYCQKTCHPGLCGSCIVPKDLSCLCGKHTKTVRCGDDNNAGWTCFEICNELYDCGEHRCREACHSHDSSTYCPRSPEVITSCPCGQTPLDELLASPRVACTDTIPTCGKVCNRLLPCGHACRQTCHEDSCNECDIEQEIFCGCGSTQVKASCHDVQLGLQPSCEKVCRAQMSCLRHVCLRRCCSGYASAQKRKKKRLRELNVEDMEPEHVCTIPCQRTLSCGNHACSLLCHRGACPPCLEASFEEISCACGGTVLSPPIACGTPPPVCSLPCARVPTCGHARIPHECHPDTVACPRCPYLVERVCLCGKNRVKNRPCWQLSVSCGEVCGKALACGHACNMRCHEGSCGSCKQTCGRLRSCGHACPTPCHADMPCPEGPCSMRVTATCACGHIKMMVRCGTSTSLECTDFCAAAARSQQLSEALGSGGEKRTTPPGPVEYPSTLLDFYKDNKIWCTTIEETMRSFCADPAAKAKMFKPMRVELRQFVHELAEVYGLRSESLDEEPHRAVQISKTSGTFVPLTKLAHAVPASASALEQMKRPTQAYNAFVLLTLQFGLTSSELMEALKVESKLAFDCHFTPDSENAYLLPTEKSKAGMSPEQVEVELARLKPRFRQIVSKRELAGLLELCWLNKDGIMSYREGSRKKQIVRPVTAVTETSNTFSALMLNEASA